MIDEDTSEYLKEVFGPRKLELTIAGLLALPAAMQASQGDLEHPDIYAIAIGGWPTLRRGGRLIRDFTVDEHSVGALKDSNDSDEVVVSYGDLRERVEYTDAELEYAEIAGVTLSGSPDSQEVIEILEGDDVQSKTAVVEETEDGYNVDIYGSFQPPGVEISASASEPDTSKLDLIARLEYRGDIDREENQFNTSDSDQIGEMEPFQGGVDRR